MSKKKAVVHFEKEEVDKLDRRGLQSLAKRIGIKANSATSVLREDLKQFYDSNVNAIQALGKAKKQNKKNSSSSKDHCDSSSDSSQERERSPAPVSRVVHKPPADPLLDWFNKYVTEDSPTEMEPVGVSKLAEDINLPAEDVKWLVISFHLNAAKMGHFTLEEWRKFATLKIDGPSKLKSNLPFFDSELGDVNIFKKIYQYAFDWGKNIQESNTNKSLETSTAIEFWKLLLGGKPKVYKHIEQFCNFLSERPNIRAINRDQWDTFFTFSQIMKDNFENYDEDAAWPTLMDDFVDWRKKNLGLSKPSDSQENN